MGALTINDINTFDSWLEIIGTNETCFFAEESIDVSIFGEDEQQYLVINDYHSDTEADEYYFQTVDENNRRSALLNWLSQLNYSLRELLALIRKLDYKENENGYCASYGDMLIFRSRVRQV